MNKFWYRYCGKEKEKEMYKFKVGDKVRIRSDRGRQWNAEGKMDKWCGQIATISKVNCEKNTFEIEEADGERWGSNWSFRFEDAEPFMPKFKTGDKVKVKTPWLPKDVTGTVKRVFALSDGVYFITEKHPFLIFNENHAELVADEKSFKVGDRVVYNGDNVVRICDCSLKTGAKGTIKVIRNTHCGIGVEWDEHMNGYDLNGLCEDGYGSWVFRESIDKIENHPTITIHVKDATTTALMKEGKKVIKKAVAKCHPDDEFDFNIGAELAFKRLIYGDDYSPEWGVFEESLLAVSTIVELEKCANELLHRLKCLRSQK